MLCVQCTRSSVSAWDLLIMCMRIFFSCVHIYMGLSFYMAWRLLWVNLCNDDPTYTEEKQGTHVEERNLKKGICEEKRHI